MAEQHLHIVSFDVPWPPDYGGVIDVYYKARALAAIGVKVHLHCYEYGRGRRKELEQAFTSVSYHKRHMGRHLLINNLPYVVVTRRSEQLVKLLMKDTHPILFEGLHSCYHLGEPALNGRTRLVRAHNVEHEYDAAFAVAERNAFRRTYFNNEARKLRRYEPVLSEADAILAISPKDHAHFAEHFRRSVHVPAFHPNDKVEVPGGIGEFCLYHGALGVPENDRAALYLVRDVFNDLSQKLVIAGSGASTELKKEVAKAKNVTLLEDVPTERIHELVREAQVNVLPTFQATGIKLKLLLCLFTGRHVVCNTPMVKGTGLEDLCHVHDDAEGMRLSITACMGKPVDGGRVEERISVLEQRFSNRRNAEAIVKLLK